MALTNAERQARFRARNRRQKLITRQINSLKELIQSLQSAKSDGDDGYDYDYSESLHHARALLAQLEAVQDEPRTRIDY